MLHYFHIDFHKFSYFYYEKLTEFVKVYQELPPIFRLEKTRWGDDWNDMKYPTKKALLSVEKKNEFEIFFEEADLGGFLKYKGFWGLRNFQIMMILGIGGFSKSEEFSKSRIFKIWGILEI